MGSLGRQRAATSTRLSRVTIERPSAIKCWLLYSALRTWNSRTQSRDLVTSRQKQWLDQVGSVLESLNQGVIISDEDRRIIFANSMFLEMGKMSAEDLLGRSVMDLYPADEAGRLQEFIARREVQGRAQY